MAKVSVIVPVYNAEKYLKDCLDSVTGQTLRDLEIICVNDGSTDKSAQILENYAEKDSRIKVIHKENSGLVSARKTGVAAAAGTYVGYVDSDDWIEDEMYERLYDVAERHGCDIVASGLFREFSDSAVRVTNTIAPGLYGRDAIRKDILPHMLYNGIYYQMGIRPNLVNKLFRKEVLLGAQMNVPDNITNGEDVAVTYPSILCANKIGLTDDTFYHYRQHDNSMSKTVGTEEDLFRIRALYRHLRDSFCAGDSGSKILPQLNAYISNILVQRCFYMYDRENEWFSAFGDGVCREDTVAVYGAGNFGRQIYDYATKKGIKALWIDQRYDFYKKRGLPVISVEELMQNKFDHLLIAIMDEMTAGMVRNNLIKIGIPDGKIKWLDTTRLVSEETLDALTIGNDRIGENAICNC